MSRELLPRQVPTGARNGLDRKPHDYTYRGKLPLEVELPYECAAGCGRRMEKPGSNGGVCAACRGDKYYEPDKCPQCGRRKRSKACRKICGD